MMSQRKLQQKKKTIKKIKHHPEKSNFQHGVWMGVDRAINKKQAHTKTYKDWCNFLSDKIRWCLNIIICHKIQVMFDILNTKYNSDTDTKGTVIIYVKSRNFVSDNTFRLLVGIRNRLGCYRNKVQGSCCFGSTHFWNQCLCQTGSSTKENQSGQFHSVGIFCRD